MAKFVFFFCLLFSLGLSVSSASATTVVPLDIEALSEAADYIVIGEVKAIESRWLNERQIVTEVTFVVHESLKGEASPELTVLTLGGRVEEIGQWIPGEAYFKEGEHALLFLEARGGGLGVVGLGQGKFTLHELPGEFTMAIPQTADLHFASPEASEVSAAVAPVELGLIREELESILGSGPSK